MLKKKKKPLDFFSHESHIVLPKEEFWLLKREIKTESFDWQGTLPLFDFFFFPFSIARELF